MLTSLKGLEVAEFLKNVKKFYKVEKQAMTYRPVGRHEMGMYIDQQWYQLNLKEKFIPNPHTTAPSECLDVYLFNKYILKEILGIEDIRTEPDVKYIEGTKGPAALERKVDEEKAVAAFNLYPVAIEDLIVISNIGGTLPPKSTYIEPRMRNGLVAQLYT